MRHRSVLLYEMTGAGKTYVACALAQILAQHYQHDVAIVAPAHLIPHWKYVLQCFQLSASCHSYQAASLGKIPNMPCSEAVWILDEAHMLKNPASKRYQAIKRLTARHRVCLLTATPISMGWNDLYALVRLCGYPDKKDLIMPPWIQAFAASITPQTYVSALNIDNRIKPQHVNLQYHLTDNTDLIQTLMTNLHHIEWYTIDSNANLSSVPLLSSILMHRLCSHKTSCLKTLLKLYKYYRTCRINHTQQVLSRKSFYKMMGFDGKQNLLPFDDYLYGGISDENSRQKLDSILKYIQNAVKILQTLCKEDDDKYIQIRNYIKNKHPDCKIIVFSQYADTARYFAQKLYHDFRVALLTADESSLNGVHISSEIIMAMFDPNQNMPHWWHEHQFKEAQILVCSDGFACGHNFQSASVVIHLDTPWNPTTLKQRIGRIVRKGQTINNVNICFMTICNPPSCLKQYESKLYARLSERQMLQNDWLLKKTKPLDAQAFLICQNNVFPSTWAYTAETWVPVAPSFIPFNALLLNEFWVAIDHSNKSNYNNPTDEGVEYLLDISDNTHICFLCIETTTIKSAFYPCVFKLRKLFQAYWNAIRKYQYVPESHQYIQDMMRFIFQCAIYPQLLSSDFDSYSTPLDSVLEQFQKIPKMPLSSAVDMQTPCAIISYVKEEPWP